MNSYASILFIALCLTEISAHAQTPYDSFAPETSRPMLGLDAINMMENPSQCNVINDSIWSTKPSADDISKWLSVDPLADKYPSISPYAYCSWNPIKYVDPDGRWSVSVLGNSNRTKYPYALYKVRDNNGNVIFQTIVKARGTTRNRKKEYGDTPYGVYKQNKWRNDTRFGKNDFIDQTYMSGEGTGIGTDNRDKMHTHGGGDYKDKEGNVVGLKGTYGCFRMADEDLAAMKEITDALENLNPSEHMTYLIFSQDENLQISDKDFVQAREDAIISNGTILLPAVTVIAPKTIE